MHGGEIRDEKSFFDYCSRNDTGDGKEFFRQDERAFSSFDSSRLHVSEDSVTRLEIGLT